MTLHIITAAKDTDRYPAAAKRRADALAKILGIKPVVENPDDLDEERYQAYQFELKSKLPKADFLKKTAEAEAYLKKNGCVLEDEAGRTIVYADEAAGLLVYITTDQASLPDSPWVEILRD